MGRVAAAKMSNIKKAIRNRRSKLSKEVLGKGDGYDINQ
jgi:hypothetical protein